MIASFTYGFDVSVEAFKKAKVELVTLTNYNAVLEVALKTDYINEEDIPVLQAWREDPLTGLENNRFCNWESSLGL